MKKLPDASNALKNVGDENHDISEFGMEYDRSVTMKIRHVFGGKEALSIA